jgi:hypothetical protein
MKLLDSRPPNPPQETTMHKEPPPPQELQNVEHLSEQQREEMKAILDNFKLVLMTVTTVQAVHDLLRKKYCSLEIHRLHDRFFEMQVVSREIALAEQWLVTLQS